MTRHFSADAALAAAVFLSGCGTEVTTGEITTGQTLDQAVFEAQVNPILDARGCSASGCHDATPNPPSAGGAFKIFPNAAPGSLDMMANFIAAKSFANLTDPASSKLLLEPLAGVSQPTAGPHGGGDIFPDTNDPDYMTILSWISSPITL